MLQWVCPPRRADLGQFLAGQHQEPRLDVGVVLARRWALWTVFEAVQALLGEAMAPDKDRADGKTHVLRDRSISLPGGDRHDDLGAIGVLWDLIGAAVCLGGVPIIYFGPRSA